MIEVMSESTEQRDRTFKFREYARSGAKEYWMISPKKKEIEVYINSERGFQLFKTFYTGDELNSPLFPDINITVSEIFE